MGCYNAHIYQLSKIGKSSLLVESVFQLLRATLINTQFVASHEELLVPRDSSEEVEDLKAHYTLIKAKVSSFKRDYSGLHTRLDQVSHFLEEVNIHESPANLVGRITELEGFLEEEECGSHHIEITLVTSFSSAWEITTELEEKRVAQSKDLEALQEERASLHNQLLDLSNDGMKEVSLPQHLASVGIVCT